MDTGKIIEKLDEMHTDLGYLKGKQHSQGKDEYKQILQLLERIIHRIYPEKQAEGLNKNLHKIKLLYSGMTDTQKQENYLDDIKSAIRVVTAIREESELFGFDDFKPLKEKTETTMQLGSEKFGGFFRKKKTK